MEVGGSLLTLVTLGVQITEIVWGAYGNTLRSYARLFDENSYQSRRFGRIGTLLLSVFFMHPSALSSMEWDLNSWTDNDILNWKASYLSGCNITSATSAILAQVALTAISLLDLNETHWTARGLMIAGMVLGVFSVLVASSQSIIVGELNQAVEIRLWLSDKYIVNARQSSGIAAPSTVLADSAMLPLRSSFSAQRLVALPSGLLAGAGACFLAGFGVYLGSAWVNNLNTNLGRNDNRNIIIAFVITASLPLLLWWTLIAIKHKEEADILGSVDTTRHLPSRLVKPSLHTHIQDDLKRIQNLRTQLPDILEILDDRPPRRRPRVFQHQDAENFRTGSTAVPEMTGSSVPHLSSSNSLRDILQEAAQAHKKCAEANLAVVAEYDRLARNPL